MKTSPKRNRSLFSSLAGLASVAASLRPGTPSPASNAPFLGAPGASESPDAAPRDVLGARRPSTPAASRPPLRVSGSDPSLRARGSALRRSLCASTSEGVAAEIIVACTGSAALTGWALFLNAGPFLVGVLTSLPFLAQFVHLPAAWLTSTLGRRRVALWAVALSRQTYWPLALLPWAPLQPAGKLAVLLAVAAASAALAVIGNNAWVAWMGDLVPQTLRGRYFGRRTAICTVGGTIASLLAGVVIDAAKARGQTGAALAALALVAGFAGAATTWLMSRQHDPGGGAAAAAPAPRLRDFARPLTDPNARRVLSYQITWNLGVGVAGPFFAVFMLQNLHMGFALMALQAAGAALVRVVAVPLWGRAIDRVGARPVLIACSFSIAVIPLIWLFPTPDCLWPVALDAVATGVLWSGHGLASFALPLSVAPKGTRPFFLAAFSASSGLAFAAAAALGGLLGEWIPTNLLVAGRPMYGLQVLFVISALARLAAALQATRIEEDGAQSLAALGAMLSEGAADAARRLAARAPLVAGALAHVQRQQELRRSAHREQPTTNGSFATLVVPDLGASVAPARAAVEPAEPRRKPN